MVYGVFKWLAVVLLLLTATRSGADAFHPFFISVTEIQYNDSAKTLEISSKMFTDDLETVLTKSFHEKPNLFRVNDRDAANRQLATYFNQHLSIIINGKKTAMKFLGFERENEAVWSYLESENVHLPKSVGIVNNMLYESFDTQIHLVHITVRGERKSSKLVNPQDKLNFDF